MDVRIEARGLTKRYGSTVAVDGRPLPSMDRAGGEATRPRSFSFVGIGHEQELRKHGQPQRGEPREP
jgi:hypothetical protein